MSDIFQKEIKVKRLFLIIFSVYLITSCTSSYIINSSSPSYETSVKEFNEFAADNDAEIILSDGKVFETGNVYLTLDSLLWIDQESKSKISVANSTLGKILIKNTSLGGLEGAGIGFLSGAVAGLVLALIITDTSGSKGDVEAFNYLSFPAIGGVVGALIGWITGNILGHTYDYEFQNVQQK
jgi:hypothetical protein